MTAHWLFLLDADGWLVGPESAPFPGEARVLDAALAELRNEAMAAEPDCASGLGNRAAERLRALPERRIA